MQTYEQHTIQVDYISIYLSIYICICIQTYIHTYGRCSLANSGLTLLDWFLPLPVAGVGRLPTLPGATEHRKSQTPEDRNPLEPQNHSAPRDKSAASPRSHCTSASLGYCCAAQAHPASPRIVRPPARTRKKLAGVPDESLAFCSFAIVAITD